METAAGDFVLDVLAAEDGNVIWFTKSTNTEGNVSYTFYTEDPS
jgi:acyl-CoA hydrolase